jgi:hypothetical protein
MTAPVRLDSIVAGVILDAFTNATNRDQLRHAECGALHYLLGYIGDGKNLKDRMDISGLAATVAVLKRAHADAQTRVADLERPACDTPADCEAPNCGHPAHGDTPCTYAMSIISRRTGGTIDVVCGCTPCAECGTQGTLNYSGRDYPCVECHGTGWVA